jgi:NAD+ diphosphatase
MKQAHQVTFGAGQLDRAADMRSDKQRIQEMVQHARILPIWRGKPHIQQTAHQNDLTHKSETSLAYLSVNHPEIALRKERLMFLGKDQEGPVFTLDLSDWEPDEAPSEPAHFFDETFHQLSNAPEGQGFYELRNFMAELSPIEAEIAATARSLLEWHRFHGFCSHCGTKSIIAQSGWQRDCPTCNRQHFPRTDPVVIMLITHGNSVLLGRGCGWPAGMFSLLAGYMEPGETIEAATRREVFEETGVSVGDVRYLACQPWPYPSSLMIGTHGEATSTAIKIDPEEIEEAMWMTREELLNVFAGNNPDVFPARKGSIAQFLLSNWLADRLD